MATWTPATKNTTSFTNQNKSVTGSLTIPAGSSMGLLLSLTYAVDITISAGDTPTWTKQTKN